MDQISKVLFVISNSLLIPDILFLIIKRSFWQLPAVFEHCSIFSSYTFIINIICLQNMRSRVIYFI